MRTTGAWVESVVICPLATAEPVKRLAANQSLVRRFDWIWVPYDAGLLKYLIGPLRIQLITSGLLSGLLGVNVLLVEVSRPKVDVLGRWGLVLNCLEVVGEY